MTQRKNLRPLIVGLLILLLSIPMAFAFQNEPDGFRGIKWGANFNERKDMKSPPGLIRSFEPGALNFYVMDNDKMRIGEAVLTEISYGYRDDKFCEVLANFEGTVNFAKIKAILTYQYGPGRCQSNECDWDGKNVRVILALRANGYLHYFFKPISFKKERDQLKKGAEDL
jgi:hypothetical protein